MTWVTPPGYRVYPQRINITREVLDRHLTSEHGDKPALVWNGGSWTYRELNREVCRLAAGLKAMGVMPGDVVLFRTQNVPLACAAILSTYKIGAITTLTSTLLRESELSVICEIARPKVAVTHRAVAGPVHALAEADKFKKILMLDDKAASNYEMGADDFTEFDPNMPTEDTAALAPALLFFSSGTTGKPKGILHGHRWISAMGDVVRLQMDYRPGDVAMTPGEFCFMATWGHCLIVPLYAGATAGLYFNRANPRAVLEAIASLGITKFMAVPTFYRTILANPAVEKGLDLSGVNAWMSGGEPLGESAFLSWGKRFGQPLCDMFGITEMQVVIANGPGILPRPGATGKVLPGVRLSLRDDELNEVPLGEPGRVMIQRDDPGLFLTYYNDSEKWRSAHRGDFYDTGDMMRRDADGYFWYIGRSDDLFKTRGMFVSPNEIEDALLRHRNIAEAAVVGIPDERIGYSIAAFAVATGDTSPSRELEKEVLALAATLLAPYKLPQKIEFVESLPKSAVGKTIRRVLRDQMIADVMGKKLQIDRVF